MTMCPNTGKACRCQPQEGVMCPSGPTPNDWQGLNMEAERAAFETHFCPNDKFAWMDADGNYKNHALQSAWEVWQVARRAAPVVGDDGLPPRAAVQLNGIDFYTAEQVRDAIAADRAARAQQQAQSVDTPQALAWAAFAENGNVIIWSRRRDEVEPVAAKYGRPVVPIIAYIDGRTAAQEGEKA